MSNTNIDNTNSNLTIKTKIKSLSSSVFYATGRRKTSVARIFMKTGSGKIFVNNKGINEYFAGHKSACMVAKQPLDLLDLDKIFDIKITVLGGGFSGQAGAIRLGISRAIVNFEKNNENKPEALDKISNSEEKIVEDLSLLKYKKILKENGYLTRDARKVERKKPGLHKARKAPQFSKR